jgi:hypothetical protein
MRSQGPLSAWNDGMIGSWGENKSFFFLSFSSYEAKLSAIF